jgi:hypothetical protein
MDTLIIALGLEVAIREGMMIEEEIEDDEDDEEEEGEMEVEVGVGEVVGVVGGGVGEAEPMNEGMKEEDFS